MKHLKLFEGFISSHDFLVEDDWEKYVPKDIKVEKNGKKATFSLKDSIKNLNNVVLTYYRSKTESKSISNNLVITISFYQSPSRPDLPLANNFEASIEITLGTLYILGVKFFADETRVEFIEPKAKIESPAKKKLSKLINYISGDYNFKAKL